MKKIKNCLMAMSVTLCCLSASQFLLADNDDARASIQAYLWPFSVDGNATVRGTSANIENDGTKLAGVVAGEKHFDGWSLAMEFFWGRNSNSAQVASGQNADYEGEYFSGTFGAFATVLDKQPDASDQRYVLDGFLGLRANSNVYQLEFHPDSDTNESAIQSSVDPTIGARFTVTFAPKWIGEIYGDAGGFGIGSASKLSVSAHATLKWAVTPGVNVLAGYRYFNLETQRESGTRITQLDLRMRGPTVGAEFRF